MSVSSPDSLSPLFQPLRIRGLKSKNRIVMSPMTQMQSPGAIPGDATIEHYCTRAAGGTGLIITEGIGVDHPASVDHHAIPRLSTSEQVAAWKRVTDAVHAAGAPIVAQLWHVGPLWGANAIFDRSHRTHWDAVRPMRPSGLWGTPGVTTYPVEEVRSWVQPIEPMSPAEVEDVLASYERSARLAIDAGFDGVEIHGAHGYLPDSFIWAETNTRTDTWALGAHFPATLAGKVRAAIGPEPALFYRFSQHTQQDYSARKASTPAQLEAYLGALVQAGVDILDASARRFEDPAFPELEGPDANLTLAGWAKKLTGALTIGVGGVGIATTLREQRIGRSTLEPHDNVGRAAELIGSGEFDLLAVGRKHLENPAWTSSLCERFPVIGDG